MGWIETIIVAAVFAAPTPSDDLFLNQVQEMELIQLAHYLNTHGHVCNEVTSIKFDGPNTTIVCDFTNVMIVIEHNNGVMEIR